MLKSRFPSFPLIPAPGRLPALFLLALLSAGLPGTGCMDEGGGSETTMAGVAGRVVDETGTPLAGAEVRIRAEAALPPALSGEPDGDPQAITAADGSYHIRDVIPGDYFVDCRGSEGAALVSAQVEDSLVRLPDAVLRPTGAVRGRVTRPGDGSLIAVYIYIRGLPERSVAEERHQDSMAFVLGNLPAGTYTLVLQPSYPIDLGKYQIREIPAVRIEPGDTLDLDSLSLALRSEVRDPAYSRDSTAWSSILAANGAAGEDLPGTSAVVGNRITMLFDFNGRVSKITPEIGVLDQVEYISLMAAGNPGPLQVSPEITRLRGLRRFGLEGYVLDTVPAWINAFPELANLWFVNAGLKEFPERVTEIPSLVSLALGMNDMASLPGSIAKLKRLRGLSVHGNRLSSLPPELFTMKSLVGLDLSGNQFTTLPRELMAMESLKGVDVRGNRLCGLSDEWRAWLTRQDSLAHANADPLSSYLPPDDPGWEATQRCETP